MFNNSILSLRNISKTFSTPDGKKDTVLKSIFLDIIPGQITGILGESGSGKSTLFSIIGGIDKPDDVYNVNEGVWFKGRWINFNDTDSIKLLRIHIGMIFQTYALVPSLNARDNIVVKLAYRGISMKTGSKYAEELLEFVGLKDRINYKPRQLSGGQQQRVGIARAIAGNPDIILADEPTGNLDKKNTKQIMELLKRIANSGISIVLVTHEEVLAKMYCHSIYNISDGTINQI